MANVIDVEVRTTADTRGLEKAKKETDRYGDSVDTLTDKSDASERSLIGTADIIGGIGGIMAGPGEQGMQAYITSWADLGGGLAGVLPLLKAMSIEAMKNAVAQVKAGAMTAASWVKTAALATASAARMAVAWVISLGPIVIVIATLATVGLALVALWKKSETFRNIVTGVFERVKQAVSPIVYFVRLLMELFEKIVAWAAKLVAPLKAIANLFVGVKNAVMGAVSAIGRFLSASGALMPVGALVARTAAEAGSRARSGGQLSSGGNIGFAHGGVAPGGATKVHSGEIIELPSGARVIPAGMSRAAGAGGGDTVYVPYPMPVDGSQFSRLLTDVIRKMVTDLGGGDPRRAFGRV